MPVFVAATGWLNWDGVSESGIAEGYIQTRVEWEGKEEELNVRTDNVRTDTCLAVAVTCSSTPLLRLKMLPSTHSQLLTLTLSPSPSPHRHLGSYQAAIEVSFAFIVCCSS